MKISKFIVLGILIVCYNGLNAQSSNNDADIKIFENLFKYKEANNLIEKYYGRNLCYKLLKVDKEVKYSFYSNTISLKNKSCKSRIVLGTCDDPSLVVFYNTENQKIYYIHIYWTDKNVHEIEEYPLPNNTNILLLKVELENRNPIKLSYTHIITDY